MAEENVPVAGMYRPRFLGRPTVSTQTDRQGRPATSHGHEICFSNSQAREWGLSWGSQILRKCPRLNEIIIYNPRNLCQCPACREAAQGRSYAHYDAVWRFLAEAKAAWRKQRAGAKLGVVFVNDLEFWRRGAQVVDVAHPFLFITDSTDMARNTAEASAIRDLLRDKMGSCLAKITWGPEDKVTPGRLAEFDRLTAEAALPYFFWTFDTLFDSSLYDREAVARILSANQWAAAKQSARPTYTPEVRDPQAEAILERMATREPGVQFAALRELIQKVKESDPETQRSIISMVTKTMKDTSRPIYQRWQCCYVISDSGYEPGVPDLIEVLLHDRLELMRSVAAAALSKFPDNEAAHNALLQAARQETSPQVRQELARHLGEEMPAAKPRPAPTAAPALDSAGAGNYSAAEIRNTSAEVFLERIAKPEPGHHQFDALSALTHKAKTSSPAERNRIISLVIRTTQDGNSPMHQRWQCSKILGYIGDEKAVPALIQALLHDESEIVRSVAAEALAKFPDNAAAHEALLQAARQETSERVREALTQHLGEEMPDVGPSAALTVARAVEERAPTGPPQPPPMRKPRISEPLPWPFPGGQEDQHIFNNYQQATDMYIHGALDFIQPAGTPVKAVYPGYVAAIYTNYPDWITHYFFIVTPKKGGSQGWCYTHLDPRTFTFKEGDFISQGQYLGDLVDFSVGDRPGATHLHLHYVKFSRDASGKVEFSSLIDPLYFFDWNDTQPPAFKPLVFVRNNT
ncbi:MAG: peptidoglycan DD-metalloendopeptidase family protein, partial [Armatimonadetes bacterium]|nr:peptidoglycan DD-metalloendopeptidase family protein [Armatimonadota bacterium]NIM23100.1 peptidoglycan DD-metalloendopeptidase family protein [Armatimonadota bacterium]NIM66968.1 peptidoglycan DD-metalloendopeptidase family protein [Armatimonadota bacterium]NIM75502.1 peptidoglycan DD-metalloendopeptidase family protein [Armatimonadota bacterium]NIN05157.1 peptidoglycan DD-metalloendopeptidase family protein [Armatimonadota bacterium]